MFNSLAEHLDLLAGMIYLTDISYFCVNKKVQKLQDMVRKSQKWHGFSYFSMIFSYFIFFY